MGGQLVRMGWLAPRLEVPGCRDHVQDPGADPPRDQARVRHLAHPDGEVETALDHVDDVVGHAQLHLQVRVALQQPAEAGGDGEPAERGGHAEADQAAGRQLALAHRGLRLLDRVEHVARMNQQVAAVGGQREAARRALEQPGAKMFFQLRDLPGDRRLGRTDLPRHGREAAGFGDAHERPERRNQVNGHGSYTMAGSSNFRT